uniref:transcription factor HES-1 n=1 Tax=Myxine glutinosa TaxID=7769 RepID=UPI00358F31A0
MPVDIVEKASPSPVAASPVTHAMPERSKTASEHRKSSKPIMEKRRRARINESLGQLKTLILDALKKDSSRHSKLEKADILEMTVKHLRSLQRVQMTAALSSDPSVLGRYRAGFNECMGEVTRFLSTCEGVNTEVRTRLLGHLATCMAHITAMGFHHHQHQHQATPSAPTLLPPFASAVPGTAPISLTTKAGSLPDTTCKSSPSPEGLTACTKLYGGFQLVPAPDGQLAFLIPNPQLMPLLPGGGHSPRSTATPSSPPGKVVYPGGVPLTSAALSVHTMGSDSVWRPW